MNAEVLLEEGPGKGAAMAIAAGGDFTMFGKASIYGYLYGKTCEIGTCSPRYGLTAANVYITGDASLDLVCLNEVYAAVAADGEVLFDTSGTVDLLAESVSHGFSYDIDAEKLTLRRPNAIDLMYNASTVGGQVTGNYVTDACAVDYDPQNVAVYLVDRTDTPGDFSEKLFFSGKTYELKMLSDDAGHTGNFSMLIYGDVDGIETSISDSAMIKAGDTVIIYPAAPADGYVFAGWNCSVANGTVKAESNGGIEFVMPASRVSVEALYECAYRLDEPQFIRTSLEYTGDGHLTLSGQASYDAFAKVSAGMLQYYNPGLEMWTNAMDSPFYWTYTWDPVTDTVDFSAQIIVTETPYLYPSQPHISPIAPDDLYRVVFRLYPEPGSSVGPTVCSGTFTVDTAGASLVRVDNEGNVMALNIPEGYMGESTGVDFSGIADVSQFDVTVEIDEELRNVIYAEPLGNVLVVDYLAGHDPVSAESGLIRLLAVDGKSGAVVTIPVSAGKINTTSQLGVDVGGVRVTDRNCADVLGDGTVSYDPDTKTLTLRDADLNAGSYRYFEADDLYMGTAVWARNDLTVRLEGRNRITLDRGYHITYNNTEDWADDELDMVGISSSSGNIVLTGDGSLELKIGAVVEDRWFGETSYGYGIVADGNVTVESGNITAYGGYIGIMACDGDVIIRDGKLKLTGGATDAWRGLWLYGGELTATLRHPSLDCIYADKLVLGGGRAKLYSQTESVLRSVEDIGLRCPYDMLAGTEKNGSDAVPVSGFADYETYQYVSFTPSPYATLYRVTAEEDAVDCLIGTNIQGKANMAVALYDENGKFIECSFASIVLNGADRESSLPVGDTAGKNCKVFLCDKACVPMTEARMSE